MGTSNIFDRSVAKVKNVVSEMSIEQRGFMRTIMRMCQDAYLQGWHESNGGNLSYRLDTNEIASCRSYFKDPLGEWTPFGVRAQGLQGEFFVVTAAGSYFRNAFVDPSNCLGIVEINQTGDAWRSVWGFKGDGYPTSEFTSHFIVHAVRKVVSNGSNRTVYHAHPSKLIALSSVIGGASKKAAKEASEETSKTLSQILWKSLTECVLLIPEGVAVAPWLVPGSSEIAEVTGPLMEKHSFVLWPHHGAFCAADTIDATFGLMQALEKAAGIYLSARAALGGSEPLYAIGDSEIKAAATAFGVTINEDFLKERESEVSL